MIFTPTGHLAQGLPACCMAETDSREGRRSPCSLSHEIGHIRQIRGSVGRQQCFLKGRCFTRPTGAKGVAGSWGRSLRRKQRKVREGGAVGESWQEGGHPVPDTQPGGLNFTSPDLEWWGVQKGPRGPFPSLTIPGHISLLPCPDTWPGGELTPGCTIRRRAERDGPVLGTSSYCLPSAGTWFHSKMGAVTGHVGRSLLCLLLIWDQFRSTQCAHRTIESQYPCCPPSLLTAGTQVGRLCFLSGLVVTLHRFFSKQVTLQASSGLLICGDMSVFKNSGLPKKEK